MDAPLATVLAATITGGLALVGVLVNRFRKENHTDHQVVMGMLHILHKGQRRVENKVERLDERLDNHIEFHANGGMLDNGRTVHQNGAEEDRNLSS